MVLDWRPSVNEFAHDFRTDIFLIPGVAYDVLLSSTEFPNFIIMHFVYQ